MSLKVNQVWLQQQTARQVQTGYASITLMTPLGQYSHDTPLVAGSVKDAEYVAANCGCELIIHCALRSHPAVVEYYAAKKSAS